MSSKTPTKQKSASKKTPLKSTNKKEQMISPNKSNLKNNAIQSSNKKNVNIVDDIKTRFLQPSSQLISRQQLSASLKRILTSQGIQQAAVQFSNLVNRFNYNNQMILQLINSFDAQNLNGLVYLIEKVINQEHTNTNYLNLSVWISVVGKVHPNIVLDNENIKNFFNKTSLQNTHKYHQLSALRGKISLLTGF